VKGPENGSQARYEAPCHGHPPGYPGPL